MEGLDTGEAPAASAISSTASADSTSSLSCPSAPTSAETKAADAAASAAEERARKKEDASFLRDWFPATRPDYTPRCGDVKQLVKEDFEDPHRRKHLESFKQSMLEFETFDPSSRNKVTKETADAFLLDLLKMQPKTDKEFNSAMQALRKKHRVCPVKSQLVAAYNRLLAVDTPPGDPSEPCSLPERNSNKKAEGLRCTMLESLMRKKAVRTNSGVLVITVLTAPGRFSCANDCHYCPNEPGQPRSYLSTEPAVLRANQNGWSPLRQFQDRADTLKRNGHVVDKIEVLVLGGTWSGYPQDYQEEFIRDIYYASNVFGLPEPLRKPLSLEEEQNLNESAACRIVGLTLETRPDFITRYELRRLRRFGCTRVQLGVQHVDDKVLEYINRGCTRRDAIKAIRMLKDAGFKVDVHLMPDLPSSSPDADRKMFYYILASPDLQADQWKIYPCEVTPFSTIEQWYKEGKFTPYADTDRDTFLSLICSVKAAVHPWIRLNRVVRDIPNQSIIGGNNVTNLRQELAKELELRHLRCKCIRCREVKAEQHDLNLAELCIRRYETNGGVEFFLSYETFDRKTIFGFLRLRLRGPRGPRDCPFSILKGAALLRELHVYGCLVPHGVTKESSDSRPQHAGFGRRLIQTAEILALAYGYSRMAVIAGIGTREYYKASGYHLEDTYMVKDLTVWNVHAGRADLLAVQPTKLIIEHQDMQKGASSLFLPLPPRAPQKRRKAKPENKKKRERGGSGMMARHAASGAAAAALEETEEKAEAFLAEYTEKIEELDVSSFLNKLRETVTVEHAREETAVLFTDRDTFNECCCVCTALQEHQGRINTSKSTLRSLARCASSWLYSVRTPQRLNVLAGVAVAICATAGVGWLLARRRHSS